MLSSEVQATIQQGLHMVGVCPTDLLHLLATTTHSAALWFGVNFDPFTGRAKGLDEHKEGSLH